jgi:hypothetical protein
MKDKKFGISKDKIRVFGKDFKRPKPALDSRTIAATAATAGVLAAASDFVPPMKPLGQVFKGAAALAIGAADAKRISEMDEAAANRKGHGEKIRTSLAKGKLGGRPIHTLEDIDYIRMSFLDDAQVAKLAVPVQVEILKVQTYLDLDTVRNRGLTPPKNLSVYQPGSGQYYNAGGLKKLREERDTVRGVIEGKGGATENEAGKEMKGLMRMGALEAFNMVLKRTGKYGRHLSKAFNVAEAAQVLHESGRLIYYPADKSFDSPEKFVDYLVERLQKSRQDSVEKQNLLGRYIPRLGGK